jgi:hypothetical protein
MSLALEDRYKTSFVIDWRAFIWRVMHFRINNGPSTFQKVMKKTFMENI